MALSLGISPLSSLNTLFWSTLSNIWLYLYCFILFSHLLIFADLAFSLCFNSSMTVFIPFVFSRYFLSRLSYLLVFSGLISYAPFQYIQVLPYSFDISSNSSFPPGLTQFMYCSLLYAICWCPWCYLSSHTWDPCLLSLLDHSASFCPFSWTSCSPIARRPPLTAICALQCPAHRHSSYLQPILFALQNWDSKLTCSLTICSHLSLIREPESRISFWFFFCLLATFSF